MEDHARYPSASEGAYNEDLRDMGEDTDGWWF